MKSKLFTILIPASLLAQAPGPLPPVGGHGGHWYDPLTAPYRAPHVPPVDFSNTRRIDTLLRAGNLYLSLPDAISLAIENNLDVAFERYAPPIASADLMRAKGGGLLRGIS